MEKQIVSDYVAAINSADVEALYRLMAEDHLFIDAHDNRVYGKNNMKQSWIGYFAMFPDYTIEINEILEKDSLICILGYASGTYKNRRNKENSNYWKVPAAWTAVIENNKVKQWQVYADNVKSIEIYNRNEKIPWKI